MFRLIKLAMYALVGYALYELYQGMTMPQSQRGSRSGAFGRGVSSSGDVGTGGGQNITGAGEGRTEDTLDSDGGSVRHRVGRGVVST
jgi:hypothetical protein